MFDRLRGRIVASVEPANVRTSLAYRWVTHYFASQGNNCLQSRGRRPVNIAVTPGLVKKLAIGAGILVVVVSAFGHRRSHTGLPPFGAHQKADPTCVFHVTANALYVRESPSLDAKVVRTLGTGDTIQPYPKTVRNSGVRWRQLRDHEWVSDRFLAPDHCGQ
jgi:hypothetical protein